MSIVSTEDRAGGRSIVRFNVARKSITFIQAHKLARRDSKISTFVEGATRDGDTLVIEFAGLLSTDEATRLASIIDAAD